MCYASIESRVRHAQAAAGRRHGDPCAKRIRARVRVIWTRGCSGYRAAATLSTSKSKVSSVWSPARSVIVSSFVRFSPPRTTLTRTTYCDHSCRHASLVVRNVRTGPWPGSRCPPGTPWRHSARAASRRSPPASCVGMSNAKSASSPARNCTVLVWVTGWPLTVASAVTSYV